MAKIAYDEVERLLPEAIRFVRSKIPKEIKRWNNPDVIKQIPYLVDRLKNSIPPNEVVLEIAEEKEGKYVTETAEIVAIFNAGWIYKCYWENNYIGSDSLISYATLSKLVLKALDDI